VAVAVAVAVAAAAAAASEEAAAAGGRRRREGARPCERDRGESARADVARLRAQGTPAQARLR
jgi:hypothetical protein